MKATVYLTHRVMFKWPQMYADELIQRLEQGNYDVSLISDDTPDKIAKAQIKSSDVFIGVPNKFDKYEAKKRIHLLGATKNGTGVVSSVQCAGCKENMKIANDCLWEDTLCMVEITPNDVLEAL